MLRIKKSTLMTILAASTQLCLLWQVSGCGQVQTMGGIVDNGEKPKEPSPGTPADTQQSDPSSFVVVSELFNSQYQVLLPKGFSRRSASDDQEVFLRNDNESITFVKGPASECIASEPVVNSSGIKVHQCGDGINLFEITDAEFITMRHSLEAEELRALIDSFKAL